MIGDSYKLSELDVSFIMDLQTDICFFKISVNILSFYNLVFKGCRFTAYLNTNPESLESLTSKRSWVNGYPK